MDIVAGGSADGIISLWRGDGAGGFVLVRDVHDFNSQVSVDNYDFNNDGNQDLVATVLSSGNVMYLAGNGDGTFDPPVVIGTMDTGGLGIAAPPIPSPPVPLTVSVSGPTEGVRGEELVFTLSAPGGGTVEWSIDWDNDGTIDETITGPSSGTEVLHAFPGEGSFLFNVFAKSLTTCEEGDTSHSVSMQAAVIRAGELIVGGTRGSDRIIFSLWNDGGVKVRIGNETLPDHFLDISRIIAFGGEGNDQITVAGSIPVPVTFYGGGGDDYLAGGPLDDVLSGGPGNDRLLGGEGNNLLLGEEGDDRLVGGSGDDRLEGGSGADQLMGGNGANVLLGGEGDDALSGGNGDDLLLGGEGDDTINGGYGNDILVGNNGDDSLFGKQGDDLIIGGHGADRLIGDAGRDLLISDLLSADEDEAMLLDMHQEWLMGGVPASARSSGPLSDTMIDDVSGGTDIDMFMTSPEDRVRDRDPATE